MKALRILNPFRIRRVVRQIRGVSSGGGPAAIRLARIGRPEGWFLPAAEIVLEVRARDGSVTTFEPALPVPFPYAWAYRIARRLGVPLVSSFDPEQVSFELGVPGRG